MDLVELFSMISKIAEDNDVSRPYLVGGAVRDMIMGSTPVDFDITTGDGSATKLAHILSEKLDISIDRTTNGSMKLKVGDLTLDFSTNYINEDVDGDSDLEKETLSRDFTINTVLLPLDTLKVVDLCNGVSDIKNQILKTPVSPEISFVDINRPYRALDFMSRGFTLDDEIVDYFKLNPEIFSKAPRRYAAGKINKCLRADPSILEFIISLGIGPYIPNTKYIVDVLVKNRRLHEIL